MSKPSGVIAIVAFVLFALPTTAGALPPADLTALDCVQDNDTGGGGCAVSTDGLDAARDAAVSPDGRDVYVATQIDDAVVHLRRDPTDGSLTPVGCIDDNDAPDGPDACAASTDGLDNVQDVVVSPDGRNVLAVAEEDDALVNFTRNPATGTLTPAGCIDDNDAPSGPDTCAASTNGLDNPMALAISPDGDDIYVATTVDDAVVQIRRDSVTGVLSGPVCIDDNDTGLDVCAGTTNGLDGARGVTVSPDGTSVYVTSALDDAIVTFPRNTASGALNAAGATCIDDNDVGEGPDACGSSTDAVNDARSPVVSPDGRSVYLAASGLGDQAVTRFDRAADGVLTPAGCIANASNGEPLCAQTVPAPVFQAVQGLAVSPDGDALYAVAAGPRAIVSLRRSPDGAIVPAGCVQGVGGTSCSHTFDGLDIVRNVAVSPDGRDVYAIADSDDVVAHLIGERPPVCVNRTSGGLPDVLQTVSLGCSDPNGDPVTIEILQAPGSGSLGAIDQIARTVPYTPNAGFAGIDGFSFRATADGARSNTATATLLVQADAGPTGPAGPSGPTGPAGPAGEPATKLIALLGLDVLTAKAGSRVKVRLGVTAPGEATLDVLKGSKVVATVKKSLSKAGRDTISWNGRAAARAAAKPKPLKPGKYTLRLTVLGNDGQKATDSAQLKLTKK